MPSNLRIIRLRDVTSFNAQGNLDFPEMKEVVKEIASERRGFVDYDILIDTRGVESHLSISDIWEISADLANALHAHPPKEFSAKIAVICRAERFDFADFLALCAQNRDLNVQAFTAFEDMFEWLRESSPPS
jgi:hypothetical protein